MYFKLKNKGSENEDEIKCRYQIPVESKTLKRINGFSRSDQGDSRYNR